MALTSADAPGAEKPRAKAVKADPTPSLLARAGESSNPQVHQLMAERWTALKNGDADAVAIADKALAELGFTAA